MRHVNTAEAAAALANSIISTSVPSVGIDCEGVRLGRFGRLTLLQMAIPNRENVYAEPDIHLIDASVPGVLEAVSPILMSPDIQKVFHDCREDSAALFHQFAGIKLANVLDTQVVSLLLQKVRKETLRQVSYSELVRDYFPAAECNDVAMKQLMKDDPAIWGKWNVGSPETFSSDHENVAPTLPLLRYAVQGVRFLVPLWHDLHGSNAHLIDLKMFENACNVWVDYCHLNNEFEDGKAAEKIGTPILGSVAAITPRGVYFKLNLGRTGIACTPSAMKRMIVGSPSFPPVQVGDTIELAVSGKSVNGTALYVDRRDSDWEYFDFKRRPDRKKIDSNEFHHEPSLVDNKGSDPLLRRGLGTGEFDFDSDGEDQVDHDAVLTRKPKRRTR